MRVDVQGISHNRGQQRLLRNISFVVESGEAVVISGPSGHGKSLLFAIMSGLLAADKGQVVVNEQAIHGLNKIQNQAFRHKFVALFQRPALISNLSLRENFLLPLNLHLPYLSKQEKVDKIQRLCEVYGIDSYLDQRTDVLSVGQAALASFIRGILLEPQCLLWDTPLIEVDQRYVDTIKKHLMELKNAGATIILMSNNNYLINEFADSHYVLSEGILRQHHV